MALDKPDFVAKKVDHHFYFTKAIGKTVVQAKMRREWWLNCSSIQKKSKIFNEDVEASSEKYFDDKKVSKNDLSRLIIKECCQNRRKMLGDSSKKKELRYSPLLLRHTIVLRNKLKDDKYTFLAQTFGYLSTTQLKNYSNSSWKDADFENNNKSLDRLNIIKKLTVPIILSIHNLDILSFNSRLPVDCCVCLL